MNKKKKKEYPVLNDFVYSLVFSAVVVIVLFFFNIQYLFDSTDFSIFITLLGVILGFLFTVLTILYAFEENLQKNVAFKELKARGEYDKIYIIFIDSISIIFYSLIITIVAYFLRQSPFDSNVLPYSIYALIILLTLSISLLRAYRCLFVFSLLQKVVSKY